MERAFLGSCITEPTALARSKAIVQLRATDFLLSSHQKIFICLEELAQHGRAIDLPTLATALEAHNELESIGGAAYLAELPDGCVPANVLHYARQVRAQRKDRDFRHLQEKLEKAKTAEMKLELIDAMREALKVEGEAQDWHALFHTWEEFENLPPLNFAIEGFLQESGVNLVGGLAGHGKTLLMLNMCRALLSGEPLFGIFPVARPADRVLYLVPEISGPAFNLRMRLFGLDKYHKEGRFFPRTLSIREQMELSDVRMLEAVKSAQGAHVFLDSVIRFTVGSENDSENARLFSDVLFRLLQAGAASVVGCHHSPKSFQSADYMSLENILRGSSDFGALISVCWGVRQIDAVHNRIFVQNCKARDFEPCEPFIIEGRPHLDQSGQFQMHTKPGETEPLSDYLQNKGGRPVAPDRAEQIALAASLRQQGLSNREIARRMKLGKDTVRRMLDEYDIGNHGPEGGEKQ
jgi:hypothetical protein